MAAGTGVLNASYLLILEQGRMGCLHHPDALCSWIK